jgi:hypothetical protein
MALMRFLQSSLSRSLRREIADDPCLLRYKLKVMSQEESMKNEDVLSEYLGQSTGSICKVSYSITTRKSRPARHVLFSG